MVDNINIHENSDVKNYHRAIWLSGIFDDLHCVLKFILVFIYIRTTLF
jgi:hypothetical protein